MVINMVKALLYKDGKVIKTIYGIKSVTNNKKYGYFEITEKLYHHEIITIHRYNTCDKVELYQSDLASYTFEKKPFKVVERND